MKYFEECFICPNCGTPLYKKSVMQDEDTKKKKFCGRCGFDIAAAKTEALKQLEEQIETQAESCENTDESQNNDKVMAEKIFGLLLKSYAPDGISVREADEVLRKVHEMFVCTAIIPIAEEKTCQSEQVNTQAGRCDINRIASDLSQKIQEFALK